MSYAIGIDLGGTQIKAAIVSDHGELVSPQIIPTEASRGAQHVLAQMRTIAKELQEKANSLSLPLKAIGVGTPGVVNPKQGGVVSGCPQMPDWVGVPFMTSLEESLKLPVHAHNDVTMMTYGEHGFGAAAGYANAVCITLGTGVGGGIITNNTIYDGASAYAGEVGHMTINYEGRTCLCGSQGCWEAYASATALVQSAQKAGLDINNTKDLFERAQSGATIAQSLIDDYIFYLGVGVANLINIFNPDVFVIGGGVSQAGDALFKPLQAIVQTRAMEYSIDHAHIRPAQLGEQAGLIGATRFALLKS